MFTRTSFSRWYRHRFVWVAVIMLTVAALVGVLINSAGSGAGPADLTGQISKRMQVVLEQTDPTQHRGHNEHANRDNSEKAVVVCGVNVFGFEPAGATTLADVDRVYGFHLCGIAEPNRPWDWAVKLVGPVIMEMSTEPPVINVAEATLTVPFVERVRQMFPDQYEQQALKEALTDPDMADLRRRYDDAAGL